MEGRREYLSNLPEHVTRQVEGVEAEWKGGELLQLVVAQIQSLKREL